MRRDSRTNIRATRDLVKKIEETVNHKVKLYPGGESKILNNKVTVIAGGGNLPEEIPQIAKFKINTFITGVTKLNKNYEPSVGAHSLLKELKINLIGATHYSTEKFACIAMYRYFRKLGLPTEFIESKPLFSDM